MSNSVSAAVPPLWPQKIPIIGGTGEKWSGKTMFGLSICPGNMTTLVYDFEQSSTSYEDEFRRIGMPFKRVDVQKEMHDKFPNGYKPVDLFTWWLADVRTIKPGTYRVIMVDPATDLERGLVDWVAANPKAFGHTEAQYAKMSGVMWGDAKDFEKMLLADITARCECFYFTAHTGAEFKGNTATGNRKAKGKETLYELASLFLWFDRSPDASGARPNAPCAAVQKSRLIVTDFKDGELVSYPVLPPRLPVATPKAIRNYFANPAGKIGIRDEEKAPEKQLSADERLRLELAKAEAERDAAQARAAVVAAQQPAPVVIKVAPDEENRNSPESWEFNFNAAISQATTPAELNDLPPQIKLARERGYIGDDNVARLRNVYAERVKLLETKA